MNVARRALKGVTYHNRTKTSDGYTLLCTYGRSVWSSARTDVWLIDMEGNIVHRWRMNQLPGLHAILLESGNLAYPAETRTNIEMGLSFEFCGFGGEIVELDWDGNVVWKVETPYQNHDFLVLPNHHVMYPVHADPKGILPDETAARWKGGIPGTEVEGKIYGDNIYEKDENGKTIWEWISYEHLDPEIDTLCPYENRSHWHFNALWICKDGNILVSPRHLNEVLKIEYPSGKVIARYGKGKIFHQHDVRELDNGNILVFDNGTHRHNHRAEYSRVVEIDPNTDEIVWEYKADNPSDFYSPICSGAERLPNGNTIICSCNDGRIFEVTYDGELVWEYHSPFIGVKSTLTDMCGNLTFRAHRYPANYSGLRGKDLDPARYPWENRFFGPDAFKKDFTPCIF
jgi:hypothetical protein